MDGELGHYVRAQIAKDGLLTVSQLWDNGFRQVTSSTREIRDAGRSEGLQDARAAGADPDLAVPGARRRRRRRSTSTNSIPRCRPRSSRARRTRWPSSRRPSSTRCRNPEHDQPRLGRLPDPRQPAGLGAAAEDLRRSSSGSSPLRPAAARGHRQAQRQPPPGPHRQGHGVSSTSTGPSSGTPWTDELLQGLEDQVRRRGLDASRGRGGQTDLKRSPPGEPSAPANEGALKHRFDRAVPGQFPPRGTAGSDGRAPCRSILRPSRRRPGCVDRAAPARPAWLRRLDACSLPAWRSRRPRWCWPRSRCCSAAS